jgi:hypothetical protein
MMVFELTAFVNRNYGKSGNPLRSAFLWFEIRLVTEAEGSKKEEFDVNYRDRTVPHNVCVC